MQPAGAPPAPAINRQAVVIIHGMGEQRPNATLRGFMQCLVDQITLVTGRKPVVFEKPDKVSATFETRSKTLLKDEEAGRPTTHLYEFYWAYHMRDNKWGQIFAWLRGLLFRPPARVPARIRKVFWWLWSILVVCSLAIVAYLAIPGLHHLVGYLAGLGGLVLVLRGLAGLLQSAIVNSLGDAARYMSDYPDNIEQRQAIRREGVELLRHLHQAKDDLGRPLYDRVIVASHSLGTVIAYDLLRLFWVECSETFNNDIPPFVNAAMQKMEAPDFRVTAGYRQDQFDCWRSQRRAGNSWLVTDLITMGCPLAYFDYLIVGNSTEFQRRIAEREYPTCPPQLDKQYGLHWPVDRPGRPDPIDLLSYSSVFACTRWTNLYFDTDFIGGPLQPVLGKGIDDIEIPAGVRGSWLPYPFGHTHYWEDGKSRYRAFGQILTALNLDQ